jgi:response regulator NasT
VLLAEDDDAFRELIATVLTDEGYQVSTVSSGVDLVCALSPRSVDRYDVVVSDIRMRGISGLDVLVATPRESRPPFVLISGFADEAMRRAAVRAGVAAFVSKPFELHTLAPILDVAIARGSATRRGT